MGKDLPRNPFCTYQQGSGGGSNGGDGGLKEMPPHAPGVGAPDPRPPDPCDKYNKWIEQHRQKFNAQVCTALLTCCDNFKRYSAENPQAGGQMMGGTITHGLSPCCLSDRMEEQFACATNWFCSDRIHCKCDYNKYWKCAQGLADGWYRFYRCYICIGTFPIAHAGSYESFIIAWAHEGSHRCGTADPPHGGKDLPVSIIEGCVELYFHYYGGKIGQPPVP